MDDDPREDDARARADQRIDEDASDASERWTRWQRAKASAATLGAWDAEAGAIGEESGQMFFRGCETW